MTCSAPAHQKPTRSQQPSPDTSNSRSKQANASAQPPRRWRPPIRQRHRPGAEQGCGPAESDSQARHAQVLGPDQRARPRPRTGRCCRSRNSHPHPYSRIENLLVPHSSHMLLSGDRLRGGKWDHLRTLFALLGRGRCTRRGCASTTARSCRRRDLSHREPVRETGSRVSGSVPEPCHPDGAANAIYAPTL